jgi:hypothetical protein
MSGSIDGFPFRTDIWRDETDPDLTRVTIRLDNDILDHFFRTSSIKRAGETIKR